MKITTVLSVACCVLAVALPAAAQTPELLAIQVTPASVEAGTLLTIEIETANATDVEALFIVREDGTSSGLHADPWAPVGAGTFMTTVSIPANALNGGYQVQELGMFGLDGATYRFLNSGAFSDVVACPDFQNIGVFACSSDLLRDFSTFVVFGGLDPLDDPELLAITMTPTPTDPGTDVQIAIEVTNSERIESVFLLRPAGTSGNLFASDFTRAGDVFTGTIQLPDNTATGAWQITELGIENAAGQVYRFLESERFDHTSPCPDFENNGLFVCASTVLTSEGILEVGGNNFPLPDPELTRIRFVPADVAPGDEVAIEIEVTNSESIESVFFNRPDGTFGDLHAQNFIRSGDVFVGSVHVPSDAVAGEWLVSEFGVRDAIDEVYRFLSAEVFGDDSPCPAFQNTGVFSCVSTVLGEQGRLVVAESATPQEQLVELLANISAFETSGEIESGAAADLTAKLESVARFLRQERPTKAVQQLDLLLKKLELHERKGRIGSGAASELASSIQSVRSAILSG